jgi:monothiol glutaredoxin
MEETLNKKIDDLVKSKKVFLFMKGTPDAPQCGFSAQVVKILSELNVEFGSFDVLSDETIREGVKEYSDWPTIPQLFITGKFIGGCDIVMAMQSDGTLEKEVN